MLLSLQGMIEGPLFNQLVLTVNLRSLCLFVLEAIGDWAAVAAMDVTHDFSEEYSWVLLALHKKNASDAV